MNISDYHNRQVKREREEKRNLIENGNSEIGCCQSCYQENILVHLCDCYSDFEIDENETIEDCNEMYLCDNCIAELKNKFNKIEIQSK